MNDLPYWGVAAIQIWICTQRAFVMSKSGLRETQSVTKKHVCDVLAEFIYNEGRRKRPLLISQEQAKEELLATLRCGELKARGVRRDPDKRKPVSDTVQDIPTCDWMILRSAFPLPKEGAGMSHSTSTTVFRGSTSCARVQRCGSFGRPRRDLQSRFRIGNRLPAFFWKAGPLGRG